MNKFVITGASGFLGKRLVEKLLSNGNEVWAVVRNPKVFESCSNPLLHTVICELANLDQLPKFVQGNPTHFIHLAWDGSTGSRRADYTVQLQNVNYSMGAVLAANKLGCKRFMGAGTLAELDASSYIPLDGSHPNLVSQYASAKITSHFMTKALCNDLQIEHVWPYISNTFGPGNFTGNFVNFAICEFVKKGRGEFTPGEQFYDFVYFEDTIQGLIKVAEHGKSNFSYYIGSNSPRRLKEYILEIRDQINRNIDVKLGVFPFNGVSHPEEVFSCSKIMEDTGYKPLVSFKEGLSNTIPWVIDNLINKNDDKKI